MLKSHSISLIRLIAMLMIITCHILQGLSSSWAFWFNIGVQIFLIISGYLYGSKNVTSTKEFYIKQIKKILVPYLVLAVIIFTLEAIFLNKRYSITLMLGSLLGFGGVAGNSKILSHTWYITYILICYLLIPLLQRIFNSDNFKQNAKNFMLLTIFIQALEFFDVINVKACWINTFIFGYAYKRCCKQIKEQRLTKIAVFVLFVVSFPFAVILQEKINVSLPSIFNTYSKYIMNYGHVILGAVLFILLFDIFERIKLKENVILKLSDKYSYYIYLIHQIFILNSFSLLKLTNYLSINILIILLTTIVSAITLKYISDIVLKLVDKTTKFKLVKENK